MLQTKPRVWLRIGLANQSRPQGRFAVTFDGGASGGDVGKISGYSTLFPSARAVMAVPPVSRTNAMSKRDAFYDELFDDDGLRLPDDASQREGAAQRLLGATLVANMDTAIKNALSLVESQNPYPKTDPPTPLHEEHQSFCNVFAAMTDEQREVIGALIKKTASLMLYGICVKFDQFPGFQNAPRLTDSVMRGA